MQIRTPLVPLTLALFVCSLSLHAADVFVKNPQSCPAADAERAIDFSESPLRLFIPGVADCQGNDPKGSGLRVWRYPHHFQRLAAAKVWKVLVERGDGDRSSYILPANSVIGIFYHQLGEDGKWKPYRGSSKNPIAFTQPSIALNLEKATQRAAAGLKQQFLVWNVLTADAPEGAEGNINPAKATGQLRVDSIWIWQGLNPLPKKLDIATGKARVSFQAE